MPALRNVCVGQLASCLVCGECGHESRRVEEFVDFSLPLHPKVSSAGQVGLGALGALPCTGDTVVIARCGCLRSLHVTSHWHGQADVGESRPAPSRCGGVLAVAVVR